MNYVTSMDHRRVRRVPQNQSTVRMKKSIRSRGYHRLKNRLLHQSHHHHLQRRPLSVQVPSSSGSPSFAVSLKRRFLDRRVRLEVQDDVPEVVADRDLLPRVAVVRLLQASAGGMTIVPGDGLLLPLPLQGHVMARERGLRKGFATVIVIEIAIAIEVVTVANLPETTVAVRAVVTIGEDRARTLGIVVDRAPERDGLGPSREANPMPVIIAGIDHLR